MKTAALLVLVLSLAGGTSSATEPRAAIAPAISYLTQSAHSTGGWSCRLDARTTALGILILQQAGEAVQAAQVRLASESFTTAEDLGWQCVGTSGAQGATALESWQQTNGSWEDDPELTSWAAWALAKAGRSNAEAVAYLTAAMHEDGSWGEPYGARPDLTGAAIQALATSGALTACASGVAFLRATREAGQGWSTPYDTALALLGLLAAATPEIEAASNLRGWQDARGFWRDPAYPDDRFVTALSLLALLRIDAHDPAVAAGVAWLKQQRSGDAWYLSSTAVLDTAATLDGFWVAGKTDATVYRRGLAWLAAQHPPGSFETALTVAPLIRAGSSTASQLSQLAAYTRSNGGIGADVHSGASLADTEATLAAYVAGAGGSAIVDDAVSFLVAAQLSDGGWGEPYLSTQVLRSLCAAPRGAGRVEALTQGGQFLLAHANTDGSFGTGEDVVVTTSAAALALMDLAHAGVVQNSQPAVDAAIQYLVGMQLTGNETPTPTVTPTFTATPTLTPTPSAWPGDFNHDQVVSSLDLFLFGSVWEQSASSGLAGAADLNSSGSVESRDVCSFARLWHHTYANQQQEGSTQDAGTTPAAIQNPKSKILNNLAGSWNNRVYDTALALEAIARYVGTATEEYVTFTVSGHTYQSDGSSAYPNALLRLNTVSGQLRGDAFQFAHSNAQGFFQFSNLGATPQALLLILPLAPYTAPSQQVNMATVHSGDTVTLNFTKQ